MGNNERERRNRFLIILIVIVIIVIVIVYLASFGYLKFNPSTKSLEPSSEKQKEIDRHRHDRLVKHLEKEIALKAKLDRKVKIGYFIVRVLFALAYIVPNVIAYFCYKVDLGDLINISEAGLILILIFCFLRYDKPSDIHTIFHWFKLQVENYVYGKYDDLDSRIEKHKSEISELKSRM